MTYPRTRPCGKEAGARPFCALLGLARAPSIALALAALALGLGTPSAAASHRPLARGSAAKPSPRLSATVKRRGAQVTVTVKTAKGAEGAIALSAAEGTTRAKVSRTGHTFTFTAAKSGRWRITVSFTGARGWNSQKLRKSLTVPATGPSAQTVLSPTPCLSI